MYVYLIHVERLSDCSAANRPIRKTLLGAKYYHIGPMIDFIDFGFRFQLA